MGIAKPVPAIEISPETVQPRVLTKGFLSKTVESPEMVADRLTKAVTEVYAPAVERARKADLEARRVQIAVRPSITLQKRAEPFLPADVGAKLYGEQQHNERQRMDEARAKSNAKEKRKEG